jgi:ABC-2 type transport system permease protein
VTSAVRHVRHVFAIARRELGASVHSPIAWVVLVLFLVVQGYSFWAVLEALADPKRPAPYGAVLRTHFGGTFLYWVFIAFVAVAITMRLVAEERRQGTWETLCAAPVTDASIIVGKWLGALGFWTLLWLPTLAYPAILRALAPPGAAPDLGPIVSAYAGVLVTGASFVAVGLAASASTSNQIVAAVLGFVALLVVILVGTLPDTAPGWFSSDGAGRAVISALDVRRHMDDFARGVVDARHLGVHAGLTVVALVTATMLAGAGRRAGREWTNAALGVALVLAAVLLVNVELARHPARLDATRAHIYTLEARTKSLLADVHEPVHVLVLAAQAPEFVDLYDEVDQLLGRFHALAPLVQVERIDPALDPGRIESLAEDHHVRPEEITGGGIVVFLSGDRHRAVSLLDLAEVDDQNRLQAFHGEEAFAAALLEVTDDARPEICFAQGHGELPLAVRPDGQDVSAIAHALERDGTRASELADLAGGVPARCAALAIVGPRNPLPAPEAIAIDRYLGGGGRLLLAVDPEIPPGGSAIQPTGLENVLPAWGVKLGGAIVLDPEHEPGIALSWTTLAGYGAHPISASFLGRRATYWFAPRWIQAVDARDVTTTALVSSSADGWAESDVGALRAGRPAAVGDGDAPGPASVAVAAEKAASGTRLVVFGSARTFASEVIDRHLGASDLLFSSAIAWLTGRHKLVGVGAKNPEQFRLSITRAQTRRLFVICVLVLPLLAGGAGLGFLWRRRRES